jgi:Glycosyltransferase family 87
MPGKSSGMKSVRLTLFALFSYLMIVQLVVCISGLKFGPKDSSDFRQLYTAGYMVRQGHGPDLYNYELEEQLQNRIVSPGKPLPFDHFSYEALLFAPFSVLRYSTAYFAFAGFNILLLVAAQHLFRPYLSRLESLGKFVPEAIFFCFLPAAITVILGQDSILLLVLAVLAFLALEKGQEARSGLLLSLGFFKFQLILPIVLLFLLWRRWRFVLGAASGGFAVLCLSTWITGFSGMQAFARTMVEMSIGLSSPAQRLKFATFPNAMPNLRGFIDTLAGSHLSAGAIQVAVIACSLVVILLASRMPPSLHVAILVAVLVSYHGLIHDSTLLALPLGMFLVRSISGNNLILGIFDMLLFACPAILFQFWGGRFFLMAIPILVLLFLQRTAPREAAPILSAQ